MPLDRFATTHWTLVVDATTDRTPAGRQALSTLCERYWPPLYAYLRRCGHSVQDAQDLTQGFFVHVLETRALDVVDPTRGRFRSFLLASLNHYVAHQRERQQAQKRGGNAYVIAIDAIAEARYEQELCNPTTPEKIFERQWALTVLDQVLSRLRAEYEADGKCKLFDHLKGYLTGDPDGASYRDIAAILRVSEGALRVAVHRLRRRYGTLLREEIAQTVSHREEIEGELAYLMNAVSS